MRKAAVALTAALALAGCAQSGDGPGGTTAPTSPPAAGLQQVRVLADESLKKSFDQVETSFEVQNPSTEIVLTYGEGIDLARQITGGQAAEVFVTEDPSAMATVTSSGFSFGQAESIGSGLLSIIAVTEPGEPFVTFVLEGDGKRVLTDTGLLRP
ncbi:substrate-binding domain-containing protein [Actinoplanes sp. NPDC051861]|uniref:substrate-binding domain-containing protein n=1 Tax=Actinoplanes sp. NPDC051861 TaxID=3155170 RepID=UPI003425EF4C